MSDSARKRNDDAAFFDGGDSHGSGSSAKCDGEDRVKLLSSAVKVPASHMPPLTAAAATATDSTLPLPQSFGLAATYTLTSMIFFLLIRYSKNARLGYNNAFAVFCIEMTKLTVSVTLKYREDGEFLPATVLFGAHRRALWREGLPYAVPSFLYAVYNNLTFFNLNVFDAGTYQVFMQTRILFTGALFSVLLHQALTVRKWGALLLLAIGVASKYFSRSVLYVDSHIFFVLFQAFLSSMAGVYNEYAFKKERHLSIHQQNFFMYLYALFFNALFGVMADPSILTSFFATATTTTTMDPAGNEAVRGGAPARIGVFLFASIVFFGAATGLSAAFILKFINVIVKAFASAIEILLTAVAAALLLGEALTGQDVLAACIVMASVWVYYTRGCGDDKLVTFQR